MIKEKDIPTMWTLPEAAKHTNLSYAFLYQCCKKNLIPYCRAGRKYLINADRLIHALNTGIGDLNTRPELAEGSAAKTE